MYLSRISMNSASGLNSESNIDHRIAIPHLDWFVLLRHCLIVS